MTFKQICSIFSLLLFASPLSAAELCGKAAQGEILVGRAPGMKLAVYNDQKIPVAPDGTFLLAVGRDDKPYQKLALIAPDNRVSAHSLQIAPTKWDIQNIKGIPPRKVTPSDSDLRDIEKEQKLIRTALLDITPLPYWSEGFIMPVKGRISGSFGGQRIMNKIKKNPHAGMDIAAPAGTPIAAAAEGIVTLAEPDLFYSGNVVILDHGYGLHTIYAHLQEINVKPGDKLKRGDILGLVGSTGRATGPHLHWGASLSGTKFNPLSLLNLGKSDNFCFNL